MFSLFSIILSVNWDLVIVFVLLIAIVFISSGSPSKWFPQKSNWWIAENEEKIKSKNKDKHKK